MLLRMRFYVRGHAAERMYGTVWQAWDEMCPNTCRQR